MIKKIRTIAQRCRYNLKIGCRGRHGVGIETDTVHDDSESTPEFYLYQTILPVIV